MTVTGPRQHPCPYCGRLYSMGYRAVRGVREGSVIKIRDIEDHECPAFRTEAVLPGITFTVIPERSAVDDVYALNRYRRVLR